MTAAADRQRRYRRRQKLDTWVVPIEVQSEVIETLIDLGMLPEKDDLRTELPSALSEALKLFRHVSAVVRCCRTTSLADPNPRGRNF